MVTWSDCFVCPVAKDLPRAGSTFSSHRHDSTRSPPTIQRTIRIGALPLGHTEGGVSICQCSQQFAIVQDKWLWRCARKRPACGLGRVLLMRFESAEPTCPSRPGSTLAAGDGQTPVVRRPVKEPGEELLIGREETGARPGGTCRRRSCGWDQEDSARWFPTASWKIVQRLQLGRSGAGLQPLRRAAAVPHTQIQETLLGALHHIHRARQCSRRPRLCAGGRRVLQAGLSKQGGSPAEHAILIGLLPRGREPSGHRLWWKRAGGDSVEAGGGWTWQCGRGAVCACSNSRSLSGRAAGRHGAAEGPGLRGQEPAPGRAGASWRSSSATRRETWRRSKRSWPESTWLR